MADELPYYPPVAPQVPVADHTAAKIIASGDIAGAFTRGFAAMAQATAARQRLQLESEQMVTDAALKSRQLDIARENNLLDFKVGIKNAEALENYRNTMSGLEADPTQPGSKAWRINQARLKEQDFADFTKELDAGGLFATKPENPVEFYRNAKEAEKNWSSSTDPRIHNVLKSLNQTMEEYHTVSVRRGWEENKKTGNFEAAGPLEKVPIGRIIEGLNDPAQVDATFQLLERNGLATKEIKNAPKSWVHSDPIRDWLFGKKPQETTETLAPSFGKYMQMGKGIDFSRPSKTRLPRTTETVPTESDLPTGVTQEAVDEAAAASEDAPLPAPEALFAPTESDKLVEAYKIGMGKPGFNKVAARQYLIEEKHIDPARLPE